MAEEREHTLTKDCWCNPKVEAVPAVRVDPPGPSLRVCRSEDVRPGYTVEDSPSDEEWEQHGIEVFYRVLWDMAAHGSSVTLNYGEDTGQWECSWITGGQRATAVSRGPGAAVLDAYYRARGRHGRRGTYTRPGGDEKP